MILSKKIKVFLSLLFLFSVVVTVAIFFDFDFKRSLNIFPQKSKEVILPNVTPTPEVFTDFIHLAPNTFNLPIEKNSFEAGFEIMEKNYQSDIHYTLTFNLKEGEEIKAIFNGKIISILNKKAPGEQLNDYLEILFENDDETLLALYRIAGESLIEENQQIKAGETLAKIGKGVISSIANDNFDLTVFAQNEENNYQTVGLETKIFNRE